MAHWRPAGWSVCLPLLIFPWTIKFRSSLLALAHPCGPGKRAVKRLWCGGVCADALTYLNCRDSQVVPYAGFVGLFVCCSSRLSISFAFFLHGESTVCASIDVRQHPPLHCIRQSHLRVASQLLQSGGIHGTFASHSSCDSALLACVRSSFFCHRLSCRLLFDLPPPPQ